MIYDNIMCNHTDTINRDSSCNIMHSTLQYHTIAIEIEVPCEVVPGITSALGAAASCQVHVGVERGVLLLLWNPLKMTLQNSIYIWRSVKFSENFRKLFDICRISVK